MFHIAEDLSSESLVRCLAKNYKNDTIMSVDKHCTGLHDNGSSVIETCWSTFKYFIIIIVSTYYTLYISWIIKCLIMTVFPIAMF